MFTSQSLVWLALGGLLQLFSFGKWMIPAAAWLVPLFLLHFTRGVEPLAGALGIWLVLWIAIAIANYDIIRVPGVAYFGVTSIIAASLMLPYLADRLITPRLLGFVSTPVFPLAWVTMELISSRTIPFGTWGALAFTQYGNLPLMQLVSLTGIGGIAFLITWSGSVINWAWGNNFDWTIIRTGALIYAAVWSLVMLASGARLAFAPRNVSTVRIAGIGWPDGVLDRRELYPLIIDDSLSAENLQQARQRLHTLYSRLLEDSRREARAGAKIVTWTETSAIMLAEDRAHWIRVAQHLASREDVYLLMGVAIIHRDRPQPRMDNEAWLITPEGEIAFAYRKTREIPPDPAITLLGEGRILTRDTPYGRIAAAICFDLVFPGYVRQVGQFGSDIFLAPFGDWETIKDLHAEMAAFRAVENGVSLVRPARGGVSTAIDPFGRVLATMDEFTAGQRIMVAQMPVYGVHTIYARLGDWFAWLCMAGLLATVVIGLLLRAI